MKPHLVVLTLVGALTFPSTTYAQRAVFLVRHADRLNQSEDSPLSSSGIERAERLALVLRDVGITAIYTSEFQRTKKTAEPIAPMLNITPISRPTADREGLIKRLRMENRNDIVLIVGMTGQFPTC